MGETLGLGMYLALPKRYFVGYLAYLLMKAPERKYLVAIRESKKQRGKEMEGKGRKGNERKRKELISTAVYPNGPYLLK